MTDTKSNPHDAAEVAGIAAKLLGGDYSADPAHIHQALAAARLLLDAAAMPHASVADIEAAKAARAAEDAQAAAEAAAKQAAEQAKAAEEAAKKAEKDDKKPEPEAARHQR